MKRKSPQGQIMRASQREPIHSMDGIQRVPKATLPRVNVEWLWTAWFVIVPCPRTRVMNRIEELLNPTLSSSRVALHRAV